PSTRLGRKKNSPATISSTSRLPPIIAVASRQASLMLNFMCVTPRESRYGLIRRFRVASKPPAMQLADNSGHGIEWRRDSTPVPYRAALAQQEARNAAIAAGEARELVWLLEHPPVYTAGTSAPPGELLDPRFEVVETGREIGRAHV